MHTSFFAAGLLLVAVLGIQPDSADAQAAQPGPDAKLTIAGAPKQLAAFDQALRPLLPANEEIGCTLLIKGKISGCDSLAAGSKPPRTLKDVSYYYFTGHPAVFQAFGQAWASVHTTFPKPKFTLVALAPTQQDCGTPLPQPCFDAPYCPQFGRCSNPRFPCKKC